MWNWKWSLILFNHPPSFPSFFANAAYIQFITLVSLSIIFFSFHFCILRYGFILIKESLSNLFSLASSEIFLKCNFCVFLIYDKIFHCCYGDYLKDVDIFLRIFHCYFLDDFYHYPILISSVWYDVYRHTLCPCMTTISVRTSYFPFMFNHYITK